MSRARLLGRYSSSIILLGTLASVPGTLPFGTITINKVTRHSGKNLKWALVDFIFGNFRLRNPDPFEFKDTDTLPPANEGAWFTTTMWVAEIDVMNGFIFKYTEKYGTFSVDVTSVTPELVSGTWKLARKTSVEYTGTSQSDPRF